MANIEKIFVIHNTLINFILLSEIKTLHMWEIVKGVP